MSRRDAGIWTKHGLAERGQRPLGFSGLLQAGGRAGIEETIGQHADMQCPREAREHGAQPGSIGDHGRKRTEVFRYAVERLRDPCGRWPGQRGSGLSFVKIDQQIIELAET